MECSARHPELDKLCENTQENHPVHSAFSQGWHSWPNEDFKAPVKPADKMRDLSKKIHKVRLGEQTYRTIEDCDTPAQREVYGYLVEAGVRGLTHEELVEKAHQESTRLTDSSLRTRCRELVDKGMACDSGNWRLTTRGNKSAVWIHRS